MSPGFIPKRAKQDTPPVQLVQVVQDGAKKGRLARLPRSAQG